LTALREASYVSAVIYPLELPVYPAEADGFLYSFVVVNCRLSARFSEEDQPDAVLAPVVL